VEDLDHSALLQLPNLMWKKLLHHLPSAKLQFFSIINNYLLIQYTA
jgi:hypothetical protein